MLLSCALPVFVATSRESSTHPLKSSVFRSDFGLPVDAHGRKLGSGCHLPADVNTIGPLAQGRMIKASIE